MVSEFTKVLAELSEKDKAILACAHVLGIDPNTIENIQWEERDGYPRPLVTVYIHAVLKRRWDTGNFPWVGENLPPETTPQIERFLTRVKERNFWRR